MAGRAKARNGAEQRVDPAELEKTALGYLERFSASTADLRRVLRRRFRRTGPPEAEDGPADAAARIEALIERFLKAGFLDDHRYARAKASSLHRRGESRRGIALRLKQHGITGEILAETLASLGAPETGGELAAAANLLRRRRLGPYRPEEIRKACRPRDLAALARAGFPLDVARRALDCPDPEAAEKLARGEE